MTNNLIEKITGLIFLIVVCLYCYGELSLSYWVFMFEERHREYIKERDADLERRKKNEIVKDIYLKRILKNNPDSLIVELDSLHQSHLPEVIFNQKQLTFLKVIGTRKASIDDENFYLRTFSYRVWQLKKLKSLDISNHKIHSLPPTINHLENLKMLNISNNPISEKEINKIKTSLPNCSVIR